MERTDRKTPSPMKSKKKMLIAIALAAIVIAAIAAALILGGPKASPPPTSVATVPAAPQGLIATAGNTQVSLTWTAPASDGGSAITGYNVYWGTSSPPSTVISTGTATSYTHTGLTNGVTCYYQVSAVNVIGDGPRSKEVSATPIASSSDWTNMTTAARPSARYQHAMAYDGQSDRVILFGGWDASGRDDETWAYDLTP